MRFPGGLGLRLRQSHPTERGFALILGQRRLPEPAYCKALCAFHRQMPLFRKDVRGMRTKYKMLWFVVDMYHRQRYFFICGFKQIVTILSVRTRLEAAE